MARDRLLQIVLVIVGLIFSALVYPMTVFYARDAALAMMLSVYVTLGVFLVIAARNPAAHRSLILFTAWSSFAHAAVMGTQAYKRIVARQEFIGVAVLVVTGVALIALAPSRRVEARE